MNGLPAWFLPLLSLCLFFSSLPGFAAAVELLPGEQQITEIQAGEGLGTAIALQSSEAFLGAPYYSNARGRVQLCVRSQTGVWSAHESFESPNPALASHFGLSLAIAADWLAVTELSPRDAQGFDVGRVYLYHRVQGHTWQLAQTLTAPARRPREVNGEEVWFKMQFGSAVTMWADKLVVQDDEYAGELVTTTLRFYRLRFGIWEPEAVIENVSTRAEYRVPMPMTVQENTLALGDPWWCNKLGWNSGRVHIFRFTGIPKNGKWSLDQVIEPPELTDSTGMGGALGFRGEEVMMGASRGFWTSEWNGKRWSKPQHVEVPDDQRQPGIPWTPDMAMNNSTIAVGNIGDLRFYWRRPDGWVRDQIRLVPNAHSLALTLDTVAFWRNAPWGTPRSVSLLPLLDMSLWLGKARTNGSAATLGTADERESIPSGSALNWRAWADGPVLALDVDVPGRDATARTARLSGPGAALFSLTALDDGLAKSSRFEVRPAGPLPEGDHSFTVHFTWLTAQEVTVNVTWEQTARGGTAVSLPEGRLQRHGLPLVLSPELEGFTAPTFTWRRDGKILPDQTGAVLNIASAKPEHAGAYELEVRGTAEGARVTGPCYVAIYEPMSDVVTMTDEQTARLRTKVWGPVSVQWHKSLSYDDPTSPFTAGVNQPVLTILRGRFIGASLQEDLLATASLVNPEGEVVDNGGVIAEYKLLSVGRPPQISQVHQEDFAVGDEYPASLTMYAVYAMDKTGQLNAFPGSRLTASGLPPGLELDESTGMLSGTLTKAGVYPVTWRLTDARGLTSAPAKSVFRVGQPARIATPGVYAGLIGSAETLPHFKLGGLVEITATYNGGISGALRLGADTRRFAGKLAASPDSPDSFEKIVVLAPLRGTRSTKLVVRSSPNESRITAQLVVALPDSSENWGENPENDLTLRDCLVTASSFHINTFGRHTLLLSSQQASEQEVPMGSGFLSMSISTALCVHVVGTLADGTGVTFSTPLMPSGSPMPYYCHEATRCSTLAGQISVDHWTSPIVGLNGQWMQAAKPASKNYPAGFLADVSGEGTLYLQPPVGVTLFSNVADAPGNAGFYTELFGVQPFRLTTDHRAVPHSTTSPNRLCKIDFYAPTGFYTGNFVVNEWTDDTGATLPPRKVEFRGMVLPMWNVGRGFCCFPRILGGDPLQVPTLGSEPPLSQNVQIFGN